MKISQSVFALLTFDQSNLNFTDSLIFSGENARYFRPKWTYILGCFEKVLLILNASVNFIYYCFAGREFRRHFYETLLCCCVRRSNLSHSPTPTSRVLSRITRSDTHWKARATSIKCTYASEVIN